MNSNLLRIHPFLKDIVISTFRFISFEFVSISRKVFSHISKATGLPYGFVIETLLLFCEDRYP